MVEEIKQWVEEFVSVKHKTLNIIPCPFAKQALMNDTIIYREFNGEGVESLRHQLYELVNSEWDDTNEVLVLYADTNSMSVNDTSNYVLQFNNTCKHLGLDLVALEDHPDDPEILNGVEMNFGKAILVLVQRLSKLNRASAILKQKGYYDNWPEENYNDVVKWRE